MATLAPPPPATGIRTRGLRPGSRAPGISLPRTPEGRVVSLDEQRGNSVLLIFYPGDFTPVCSSELTIFNELSDELDALHARTFGISTDAIWSHVAFARELNLRFPLLSDFHPKGEASRRFEVYRDPDGICERALFVIAPDGVIFWSEVVPLEQNPGPDGALQALERLAGRQVGGEPPAPPAEPPPAATRKEARP